MKFQIKIINIQSTSKPTKNGSYTMLDVAFNNLSTGKVDGKKIMSFASKEAYAALSKANQGDLMEVTAEKNTQSGYWDWVDVVPSSGSGSQEAPQQTAAGKSFSSPKSTYETPEERAQRQVFIIKQSSLSNAIALLKTEKNIPTPEDVINVADVFYNWVVSKDEPKAPSFDDMEDDIPL